MVSDLWICGTRSFAEEVHDLAVDSPGWRVAGFVENLDPARCAHPLLDLPVRWVDALRPEDGAAICALVTTHRHRFTAQVAARGVAFATLVHPTAHVAPSAEIGEGTLVSAGAVVGARTTVGRHVIVNRGVLLGHHAVVGDHVSLLPGANVAGNTVIGERAFVGMGALVLDGRRVGARAVVAAGSVVTRDVPDGTQVMGAPARTVGETPEGR